MPVISIFGELETFTSEYLYHYRYVITPLLLLAGLAAVYVAFRLGVQRYLWQHRVASTVIGAPMLVVALVAGNYLVSPLWERSYLNEASPLEAAGAGTNVTSTSQAAPVGQATTALSSAPPSQPQAAPPGQPAVVAPAAISPSSQQAVVPPAPAAPPAAIAPSSQQVVVPPAPVAPSSASLAPVAQPASQPAAVQSGPRATHRGEFKGADDFHFGRGDAHLITTADGKTVLRFENFSVRNGPDLYVYLSRDESGRRVDEALNLGRLKATDGAFNYELPSHIDLKEVRSVVVWCRQFTTLFAVAALRAG